MINSWSLLYDELYGEDEMSEEVFNVGAGNTASIGNINLDDITNISIDTAGIEGLDLNIDPDYIAPEFVNFSLDGVGFVNDSTVDKPQANLDYKPQKYEEDKSIADLKNYVTSTYRGHYTSEQNNTQTLDLIQSVGDAESFCRSNAIKYLARYDKKGSAKNDILKAMHYCLLLYYFSGNTQEPDYTNTRYETF
tara:strand:- start:1188 stop:1766 length:579 start_codon:yes stop_codon:yes gene_type:complete